MSENHFGNDFYAKNEYDKGCRKVSGYLLPGNRYFCHSMVGHIIIFPENSLAQKKERDILKYIK